MIFGQVNFTYRHPKMSNVIKCKQFFVAVLCDFRNRLYNFFVAPNEFVLFPSSELCNLENRVLYPSILAFQEVVNGLTSFSSDFSTMCPWSL
ncbi:hypothetical protein KSS87_023768 [Heliosperma pusillum]|nr:hypothetical protein KSS87_023768 [Heliosperma pusillum]